MADIDAVKTLIISSLRAAIAKLPGGETMSMGDAVELATDVAEECLGGRPPERLTMTKDVRNALEAAYGDVRGTVARQVIGMTLQEAISIIEQSTSHFLKQETLTFFPRPTLSFTGYCKPHDIWNLTSNGLNARKAALEAALVEDQEWTSLRQRLDRAMVFLGLVAQRREPRGCEWKTVRRHHQSTPVRILQ